MGLVTKTFTFSPGALIIASEHNTNFDTLYTLVNGNLDNANIAAGAGIVASKLDLTTIAQNVNITGNLDVDGTFNLGTTNQGDILYDNGTSIVRLTPGTSGEMLQTNGAAANPTWETGIPTGAIIIWSGAISAIPAGWQICDGTNGTPNLTDRFVIHADADAAGTNNVGDTGGSHTVTLTEAQLPSHDHDTIFATTVTGGAGPDIQVTNTLETASSGTQNLGSIGSGSSHENMPAYYALAYIQKL